MNTLVHAPAGDLGEVRPQSLSHLAFMQICFDGKELNENKINHETINYGNYFHLSSFTFSVWSRKF